MALAQRDCTRAVAMARGRVVFVGPTAALTGPVLEQVYGTADLAAIEAFGIGPMAGVLAIGLHGMGALGKLLGVEAEATDPDALRGVRSTGASRAQVMRHGALPHRSRPPFSPPASPRF